MVQAVAAEITISAPATKAGVNELVAAATKLRDDWNSTGSAAGSADQADAVKLHQKLPAGSRSREALELLPAKSQGGLTPEELGLKMQPKKDGASVSKASARAAVRVIQTRERRMLEKGALRRKVLDINFENYDTEGAGRYSLSDEGRKALDEHLQNL